MGVLILLHTPTSQYDHAHQVNMNPHPSRRYSIDPTFVIDQSLESSAVGMDYEQANVESFDAASKSVADSLSVRLDLV